MALNSKYATLAGNTARWEAELRKTKNLVKTQIAHFQHGRQEVTIWHTSGGWALGYLSNLWSREILRGGRHEPGLSKEDVIRLGIEWVNEDPNFRSLEVLKTELLGTPWENVC